MIVLNTAQVNRSDLEPGWDQCQWTPGPGRATLKRAVLQEGDCAPAGPPVQEGPYTFLHRLCLEEWPNLKPNLSNLKPNSKAESLG